MCWMNAYKKNKRFTIFGKTVYKIIGKDNNSAYREFNRHFGCSKISKFRIPMFTTYYIDNGNFNNLRTIVSERLIYKGDV